MSASIKRRCVPIRCCRSAYFGNRPGRMLVVGRIAGDEGRKLCGFKAHGASPWRIRGTRLPLRGSTYLLGASSRPPAMSDSFSPAPDSDSASRVEEMPPGIASDSGEPALGYRLMADVQRAMTATDGSSTDGSAREGSATKGSADRPGTPPCMSRSLDAFRPVYETYAPRVMQFLFRMCGDRTMAEDITQEVFVRVWRAAPSWRPEAPLHIWILTIARRAGWNAMAFRRRRKSIWHQSTEHQSVERQVRGRPRASSACGLVPHERLAAREFGTQLQRAVLSLSPRLRLAFVLARFERLSLAEIADVLGKPTGTVKSRIARAEKQLRRVLSRSPRQTKGDT